MITTQALDVLRDALTFAAPALVLLASARWKPLAIPARVPATRLAFATRGRS